MHVITFPNGPLGANMYLLYDDDSCVIIDPCVSVKTVENSGFDLNKHILKAVFITHGHFDHIYMVDDWYSYNSNVPFYMSEKDFECIDDPKMNCSYDFGIDLRFAFNPTVVSNINTSILNDSVRCSYINTPGHSEGSCCFLFERGEGNIVERIMFSGDMLFKSSIGRTDFLGSDHKKMMDSIQLIKSIDSDYLVYPGHGPSTSLSFEVNNNPYFNL